MLPKALTCFADSDRILILIQTPFWKVTQMETQIHIIVIVIVMQSQQPSNAACEIGSPQACSLEDCQLGCYGDLLGFCLVYLCPDVVV